MPVEVFKISVTEIGSPFKYPLTKIAAIWATAELLITWEKIFIPSFMTIFLRLMSFEEIRLEKKLRLVERFWLMELSAREEKKLIITVASCPKNAPKISPWGR